MERATSDFGRSTVKVVAAFAAIYVIWGSTYLAIRYALEGLPPLLMMGIRHFVAGSSLFALLRLRGVDRPPRRLWLAAAAAGACLFLGGHGMLAWAELHITSGRAALLVATVPLWLVLVARACGQEKLRPAVILGLLLGFAGVVLLIRGNLGGGRAEAAELGLLVGCLLWAIGSIYSRSLRQIRSTVLFAAMEMIAGGALLLIAAAGSGEIHAGAFRGLSAMSLFSLTYLIVFGSIIAFTAYTWLLTVSPPSRVATYAYVNPVVAVVLGWLLAGEPLVRSDLIGAVVIVASVVMVTRSRPRPVPSLGRGEIDREGASRTEVTSRNCQDAEA